MRRARNTADVVSRKFAGAATFALVLLVGASTALRTWAAESVVTPWINSDEITYSQVGRNLYQHGHLWVLDKPIGFLSLVYPALAGLPLLLANVGVGYALLKALQALVMSLTAVPVYFWTRRLTSTRWAWTAAALSVAGPGLAYSGLVMSEVAFLPLMTLAAWLIASALARPTAIRQAVVFVAIFTAAATRLQALILLPAYLIGIVAMSMIERRRDRLYPYAPSAAGFAVVAVAAAAYGFAHGSTASVLGGYQGLGSTSIGIAPALRFVLYHAADVALISGVIPACALIMLVLQALNQRADHTPELRAFLVVSTTLTVLQVIQVGTFAAAYVGHLAERNLIAVAPLLFIAFAVWLEKGCYRPTAWAWAVALAVFCLLAFLPADELIARALPDTFMLAPFQRLASHHPNADVGLLVPYAALPLLAVFLFASSRRRWLLPFTVGLALTYWSILVSQSVAAQSRFLAPHLFGTTKNWIDRAAAGPVGYVYAGELDWNPVFENIFWNRDIRDVYALDGATIPGPLPQTRIAAQADGALKTETGEPLQERFIATSESVLLAGTRIAIAPIARQILWRIDWPPRAVATFPGINIDSSYVGRSRLIAIGHLLGGARISVYRCRAMVLTATFLAPKRQQLAVSLPDGPVLRRLTLSPNVLRRVSVPIRGNGRCVVELRAVGDVALRPLVLARIRR